MIKVGLTGGIGSGKSTVAKILLELGFPVYNSDKRARWLMNNDSILKNNIASIFGENSYINGVLNTNFISNIVFSDPDKIVQLNSLVHPSVSKDFDKWLKLNISHNIIFKEAAILIESGAYLKMDKIILIESRNDLKIERILKRDSTDFDSLKKRMDSQSSDIKNKKYADYIIENNETLESLNTKVDLVIQQIKKDSE
ncbi:dephospho-CoA kinase [Flavobacteriales bacterium]|nr:dephospho-CoA kinase [Flavobacteriales bacterium]